MPSHRLNVLSKYLGIAHRHHDALSDARAAGHVILKAIEHTGRTLAEWLAPTRQPKIGPAPKPADEGPLKGERIAILGEPRDGALAIKIALLGERVVSSVGVTTTILVIAGSGPLQYNAGFKRAEALQKSGHPIRILAEDRVLA